MAKIGGGLKSLFNIGQVKEVIDQKAKEFEGKTLQVLLFIGEQFVNKARLDGNYQDRTGNLRSSIGYVIFKDGVPVESNFTGTEVGAAKGREVANSAAQDFGEGYVLIGVAGMQYAAAVEAKNYDVISGSAPTGKMLKDIFNEINF